MSAVVSPSRGAPVAWLLGAVGALLVAATLGLWAYYGTAVFFEVLSAGLAACF